MYEYTGICLCARTDKLVHRCVCDCVSVYTQTSAQISISKQAFVWEVRVHKCMGVRMYVCMGVWTDMYMHVWVHGREGICVSVHRRMCISIYWWGGCIRGVYLFLQQLT